MSSEERPTDDSDDNETVGESAGVGESSPTVLPIRMLHDRILVDPDDEAGERRSTGGILIPATVQMGRRLAWAKVLATGSSVRTVKLGDRVLFDPAERAEVELRGKTYLLLRERDVHAVAAERLQDGSTGLYL
ncbi:co-chaperone GroES [Brooklawnia propionicigenes]|uniref:10 kDa chaperonin n=2 Tax=Brooklawnia propionicigenes TaxID=3041175 RepID=A0AAN0KJ75_9ACTN|nr:co-chaperone GroES [Brooklawnia sp. SH051]